MQWFCKWHVFLAPCDQSFVVKTNKTPPPLWTKVGKSKSNKEFVIPALSFSVWTEIFEISPIHSLAGLPRNRLYSQTWHLDLSHLL